MLTYIQTANKSTIVKLDGKPIGEIHKTAEGFQYTPKGKRPGSTWSGEVMETEAKVRKSLESDD